MIYEAEKGDSIYIAAQKAIKLAKYNYDVRLIFNDIEILVSEFSHDIDICTIYNLKHKIQRLKR